MRRIFSRFRWLYLAPAFAMIALLSWALASPLGASPDDDFHLVSIWCANTDHSDVCEPGSTDSTRLVEKALLNAPCYARDATQSAACQLGMFEKTTLVESDRGNFVGAYPPVFYSVMNLFAGNDLQASALLMRAVNALLLVGLTAAIYLLLPARRRPMLVWSWLISLVPLGLFLVTSNNPSSWAIIGVGSAWVALLGYFETVGRRRIGLGILFGLSVIMAAGARADAAIYVILGIAAVLLLTWQRSRSFLLRAILPVVFAVVAALFVLTSNQAVAGVDGFSGSTPVDVATGAVASVAAAAPSGGGAAEMIGLLFSNILNTPSLWAGVFGHWSLGWFDTPMPAIVAFGGVAVFVAVAFTGIRALSWRKALVTAGAALALWAIPVITLTRGGHTVGVEVQPRYLLPLIVMLGGCAILAVGPRLLRFSLAQRILLAGTLIGTYAVSLFFNLRRYVTGDGVNGGNLDDAIEWWWNTAVSPMGVLVIGSLAWAALVLILVREITPRQVVVEVQVELGRSAA